MRRGSRFIIDFGYGRDQLVVMAQSSAFIGTNGFTSGWPRPVIMLAAINEDGLAAEVLARAWEEDLTDEAIPSPTDVSHDLSPRIAPLESTASEVRRCPACPGWLKAGSVTSLSALTLLLLLSAVYACTPPLPTAWTAWSLSGTSPRTTRTSTAAATATCGPRRRTRFGDVGCMMPPPSSWTSPSW